MNTADIRQRLHGYLEMADDKKINAIYTMVENEIEETILEYNDEFKNELDRRVNYCLDGGKMVSPVLMKKRLQALRKKRK